MPRTFGADGAAALDGRAGRLGNETDVRIFALLRALADLILVGSGTLGRL